MCTSLQISLHYCDYITTSSYCRILTTGFNSDLASKVRYCKRPNCSVVDVLLRIYMNFVLFKRSHCKCVHIIVNITASLYLLQHHCTVVFWRLVPSDYYHQKDIFKNYHNIVNSCQNIFTNHHSNDALSALLPAA